MSSRPTPAAAMLRPAGLLLAPFFSHVAVVDPDATIVLVGGQNGVDGDGQLVGDDLVAQTARALDNLEVALAAAGATLADVVQWRVAVVGDLDIGPAFAEYQRRWDPQQPPPLISLTRVHGLAVPGALVEIDAVATILTAAEAEV